MKSLATTILLSLRLVSREPLAVFLNTLVPLFFMFVFGSLFGHVHPRAVDFMLPGLFCMSVMGTALYGVSASLVAQREQGILRRFGASPVHPLHLLISEMVTGSLMAVIACGLQLLLAASLFGLRMRGSWLDLGVAFGLGVLAFMALGLLIGSFCSRTRTAMLASNALFFPFLFLGGAAIPEPILPPALQQVAHTMASSYFVHLVSGIIVRGESLAANPLDVAILAATFVLGLILCTVLFRFDAQTRLPMHRKLGAVLLLGAIFLLGFWARRNDPPARFESPLPIAAPGAHGGSDWQVEDFEDGDLTAPFGGQWIAISDRQPLVLGSSQSSLEVERDPLGQQGSALCLRGRVTADAGRHAFAGAQLAFSDSEGDRLDVTVFSGLRLKVRGDGGCYQIRLLTPPATEWDQHCYFFATGPTWQEIVIPIEKLRQLGEGAARPLPQTEVLALQLLTVGTPQPAFECWLDDVEFVARSPATEDV